VACSFRADPYPPIVLFPEGKLNPGTRLLPFFHGAFEIAAQHGITYLPCAIRYSHPEISTWGYGGVKEGMMQALWRLASFSGPLFVTVTPLEAVTPKADDDIARLALNTKYAIEETLGFEHGENQMPENVEFG
jgi:1-acyl-sn-glycerol-3-phosphate acyltransferase